MPLKKSRPKLRSRDRILKATCKVAEAFAPICAEQMEAHAYTVTLHRPLHKTVEIEALLAESADRKRLIADLAVLAAVHGHKAPRIKFALMPQTNWVAKVQADYPPVIVGRLVIHAKHQRKKIPTHYTPLEIEATNAFGTGEHPTTAGCLLALQEVLKTKRFVKGLDLGCGSGVLALAAASLGGVAMLAVDNDRDAVEVARQHGIINGLQSRVHCEVSEGFRSPAVSAGKPYDLILANIFAKPLAHLAPPLRYHLAPDGIAILSGLMTVQEPGVIAAYRMQHMSVMKRYRHGVWSVLVLKRRFTPYSLQSRYE